MRKDRLSDFVEAALAAGESKARISEALHRAGWQTGEIQTALAAFADVEFAIPVPRPTSQPSARDSFLYLLLFTALYMSAISLGTLLYQFINIGFPDPVQRQYESMQVEENLRWGAAMLIIFLPVYIIMDRKVSRLRSANPDHGRSGVRRWLTYLTLYATAIIFLSDLGFLLYIFLKGELTSRVFLKALAIAGISALIFWRYLAEMRGDEAPAREQI
ncbi:MAG TPA: DUF5671 domain-containing protein [Rhizorhapis sp.]